MEYNFKFVTPQLTHCRNILIISLANLIGRSCFCWTERWLCKWKNHIIQQKLSLSIRDKHFENNVVFSNFVLYRNRQYLYKSYSTHVNKSTKITTDIYIKVTQTKQDETAEKFSRYMAF
jgi:hypothetical protein